MQVTHVYDSLRMATSLTILFLSRTSGSVVRVPSPASFYSKTSRIDRAAFSCIDIFLLEYTVNGYFHTSQWSRPTHVAPARTSVYLIFSHQLLTMTEEANVHFAHLLSPPHSRNVDIRFFN